MSKNIPTQYEMKSSLILSQRVRTSYRKTYFSFRRQLPIHWTLDAWNPILHIIHFMGYYIIFRTKSNCIPHIFQIYKSTLQFIPPNIPRGVFIHFVQKSRDILAPSCCLKQFVCITEHLCSRKQFSRISVTKYFLEHNKNGRFYICRLYLYFERTFRQTEFQLGRPSLLLTD